MANPPTSQDRYVHIDILRAIAILGVMMTHSLAVFLGPASVNTMWNYLHFVVVAFVGCSGYVSARIYFERKKSINALWFWKRFARLYIPYVVYFVSYALLTYLFPSFIRGKTITFTGSFFISSFLMTGGIDVGWLTLLFIQLAILTPLLFWTLKDNKRFITALVITGIFPLVTLWFPVSSVYSRAVAWLPWSFIFLLGARLAVAEQNNTLRKQTLPIISAVSIAVWLVFRQFLISRNNQLTLTLHKYPPDFFYLLYGISVSAFILWLIRKHDSQVNGIMKGIIFVSRNSYGMFFLHLIILNGVTTSLRSLNVATVTAVSVSLTILITWMWNEITKMIRLHASAA